MKKMLKMFSQLKNLFKRNKKSKVRFKENPTELFKIDKQKYKDIYDD